MAEGEEKSQNQRTLTDKQEMFCQRYTTHWNATRAAKEAGYSDHTAMEQGYQLLRIPSVKKRIQELSEHALSEIGVTRERILLELSRIAFGDMRDLATWNESGVRFKPSDELDEQQSAAIAEVTESVTESGGTLKIKRFDKVKALELLGRYQKLFADRVEHSGPDGKPIETKSVPESDAQLDERIKMLLGKNSGVSSNAEPE